MVARWKVVLGVVTLLGVSMSLSQSTVLKSKAAGLVLHMRDAPISGGAIYLAVSVLITISGRQWDISFHPSALLCCGSPLHPLLQGRCLSNAHPAAAVADGNERGWQPRASNMFSFFKKKVWSSKVRCYHSLQPFHGTAP